MKKLLEGSSCIKWLLQHNRSCPENIAASVRSLRHSDWCCEILWTKVRWQNLMAVNFNVMKMYSYRWKNGFLRLFYRYTYSTFKRTHRQNQFWNEHTAAEKITQTMKDCKFSCQNKYGPLQRIDDWHSLCDKNRYTTSRIDNCI